MQFQMSVLFNFMLGQELPLEKPPKQRYEFVQVEIPSACGIPEVCS